MSSNPTLETKLTRHCTRRIIGQVVWQEYSGVGESGRPRKSHKLQIGGSNPSSASNFRILTAIFTP